MRITASFIRSLRLIITTTYTAAVVGSATAITKSYFDYYGTTATTALGLEAVRYGMITITGPSFLKTIKQVLSHDEPKSK